MLLAEIVYTKPRPREIDVATTIRLQSVGLSARRRVFGMNRTETQIKNSFNTDSPLELIKSSQTYQHYAAAGGLAVAGLDLEHQIVPVGYALARPKPTGWRMRISGKAPVLLKEVNIMPGFERENVGCQLVKEALADFRQSNSVEAFVPEEDVVIGGLMARLGFDQVPDTEPVQTHDYFGPLYEPVQLRHYRAERIAGIVSGTP